jgi:chromosome segregation ATPase
MLAESLLSASTRLCRNTIVVDDVNEARQLCYDSPDHHKVVSADGTLFKPNGNITGAAFVYKQVIASNPGSVKRLCCNSCCISCSSYQQIC